MRRKATKKPFTAPTKPPIASAATPHDSSDPTVAAIVVAKMALINDTDAPTDRSKPPTKMIRAWPMAASANAAPPLVKKLNS